jgi:hypothetical protein
MIGVRSATFVILNTSASLSPGSMNDLPYSEPELLTKPESVNREDSSLTPGKTTHLSSPRSRIRQGISRETCDTFVRWLGCV